MSRNLFNRHTIEAVLSKPGLLSVRGREKAKITELAYELLKSPRIEMIKIMPKEPIILLAVASVMSSSSRVVVISLWVNLSVVSALVQLTIVARPTCLKQGYEALESLSQHCEVLVYKHLYTKLALENSAIVTDANLTRTSLLKNLETEIYYDNALFFIRLYAEEVCYQPLDILAFSL